MPVTVNVLEGEQPVADPKTGQRQRDRITWTPNGDGTVRQLWESSTDGGATWSVAFDGTYRHAPAARPAQAAPATPVNAR